MLPNIGPMEMIIGLTIVLLLFGAKKIPELARGLGSGVREFKAGTKEGQVEDKKEKDKKDEELKAADTETGTQASTESSETTLEETTLKEDAPVETDKAEQQSR